jgi:lysophospholipase L1-like esterase
MLFGCAVLLLLGCGPSVEKVVPDRVVSGDVIDLRDPRKASMEVPGTVRFGSVETTAVLSWEPEDVFAQVPPGLTGEVQVYIEFFGLRSNPMEISILQRDPLLRTLCFGDSIVYQGLPETLQTLLDQDLYLSELEPVVVNQGKAMELVSHEATRTRWSNALDFHGPDLAILLEGTNDVHDPESATLETMRNSVTTMIDAALFNGVDLVLCTLLPRAGTCEDAVSPTTEEYNTWLRAYAAARGIPLVDLYQAFVSTPGWANLYFNASDCIHPNGQGNQKMAEVLAGEIEDMYLASCTDLDNDGYGRPTTPSCDYFGRDCDDGNPHVHPAEAEGACHNGLDDDCDGLTDGLDEDCMGGVCAETAEASVIASSPVYGGSALLRHVAFLLFPVGIALVWRAMRKRKPSP